MRAGFHNTIDTTTPTNGAYFRITAGVAAAVTVSASSETVSAETLTLTSGTWYTFDIEYLTTTSVRFVVSDDAGEVLFDHTATSTIPSSAGAIFGCGMVQWEGSASARDPHVDLDRTAAGPARPPWEAIPS